MVWYGMVWYGMGWYGMGWDGMGWYGMGWYGMGWGESGLKSDFNHSWSYLWLQVGFGCACKCRCGESLTQFLHRWAERNHSDHYTDSELASRLPNSLMRTWKAQTSQFLRLWGDAVRDRTSASRTPNKCSNHYATGPVMVWYGMGWDGMVWEGMV